MENRIKTHILLLVILIITGQYLYSQTTKTVHNLTVLEFSSVPQSNRPSEFRQLLKVDKAKHLVGSMIGTVLIYKISNVHLDIESSESKIISTGIMLSFGVGKEIWDKKRKSTGFSWADLLANGAGIILGLILVNQP